MRKLCTMLTVAFSLVAFSATVLAEDGQRFKPARDAIEKSGLAILNEGPGKDFRGEDALVLKTDKRMRDVVTHFKKYYRNQEKIGETEVVGLAHVVHSDTWNITIKEGTSAYVFKVADGADGATMTIRQPRIGHKRPAGK